MSADKHRRDREHSASRLSLKYLLTGQYVHPQRGRLLGGRKK